MEQWMDANMAPEGVLLADAGYTLSHRGVVPYRLGIADPPYNITLDVTFEPAY